MEQLLLGAMLRSRDNFNLIKEYVVPKKYSKEFQILLEKVDAYYRRDQAVNEVNGELLLEQLRETIRSEKHLEQFEKSIQEALSLEAIPEQNIKELVLQAKKQEKADELALALVNNPNSAISMAKEFVELCEAMTLDDLDSLEMEGEDDEDDLEALVADEMNPEGALKLHPSSLHERTVHHGSEAGGVRGGHCIIYFGRPEAGKTTAAITAAGGFAGQGARGLYLGNEDRRKSIVLRFIGNRSGMTLQQIERNPKGAIALARANGLDNVKIISMTPGSLELIDKLVKKFKPKWIVVDQLRNLNVKNESRVNQLDMAAQGIRNIGKKYDCITICVTQAGDSGEGKAILDMGDIDFSNTGIPAAADLLIGVGVTPALEAEGRRWLALPKNKLTGRHENFPVKIETALSQLLPVG